MIFSSLHYMHFEMKFLGSCRLLVGSMAHTQGADTGLTEEQSCELAPWGTQQNSTPQASHVVLWEEETFFFQAIELCSIKPASVSILTLNVLCMSAFLSTLKGNTVWAECGVWRLPLFGSLPNEAVTLRHDSATFHSKCSQQEMKC